VPVVTTQVGDEGLGLGPAHAALIAEDANDLARAVVRLFHEPGLAEMLATAGLAFVRDHLDAERTRTTLLDALRLGPSR
jgi:hypothetical protein